MNRYICLLLIIILCILLTGCWSYKEISSLYIIAGVAIDKVQETNKYNITIEFVNIKENQRQENFESVLLEVEGDSIGDAVTTMIRIAAKKPYWSHAATIIISEDVAREGIIPFLDLFLRSTEARLDTNIYISKEKSAKQILEVESLSTDVKSYELNIMSNESKNLVRVPLLKVYEVINQLSIPKVHIVLPAIELYSNAGQMNNQLSGGGVFSKGKLVGFLEDKDMLAYLFIKDKVKAGTFDLKTGIDNPHDTIIMDILRSNTKIKTIYGDEKLCFNIYIKTDVDILELTTMTDYLSFEGRKKLEKLAEESLEREIKDHIKDVQNRFAFDIFGFGSIIRQRDPKIWRTMEEDWDSIFMDIDVNISCDIEIKNSGHSLKPIKVVD